MVKSMSLRNIIKKELMKLNKQASNGDQRLKRRDGYSVHVLHLDESENDTLLNVNE